jgi:predicted helicase
MDKPQLTHEEAKDAVAHYVSTVADKLKTGQAREHAYRPVLEALIKSLDSALLVLNDPARSEHGNPDFVFIRKNMTIGYAETKDIGVDLDKTEKSNQMERYLGYSNLILTDYLEFRFFKNGERYGESISVGKIENGGLKVLSGNFDILARTISDFLQSNPERIKNGKRLAQIMGGKARRIRDNVHLYLENPSEKNVELERVYETIKKLLVHDLSHEHFADMYAQTLVYGLFVARFHDDPSSSFTRQEARDLVPASNPFLQHFFDHIVGPDFDKRLGYIVNELCEVFSCTDVKALMEQYFQKDGVTEGPDPVIHFYEDFLKEYDAEQRKKIGAFYTPLPVVRFIIRSIDTILEKEFNLPHGLADTEKVDVAKIQQGQKTKGRLHRVQILDPAAGTGTFLNEIIRSIYRRFEGQTGRWKSYVDDDLLPRLHGFELMMAPYTIAHLKLGMTLKETGYEGFEKRLGVYLTNSLEEGQIEDNSLFASLVGFSQSIAEESRQASKIKKERPIMVVIGNPPYSGVSSNETKYANRLVEKYKIEPGGKQKLQERKHWLNDDYVKFIAFAEDMIAKNKEGIVGFITNHGYLDNPTFRGMRWYLMDTFDSIYVIDLHGNAKKKEVSPDGSKDENVFAIQQGVSIMIAVKTGKKRKGALAKIYRTDLWGKRESKFKQLNDLSVGNANWVFIEPRLPNLFFAKGGSVALEGKYEKGFGVDKLFSENVSGIVTMGDGFAIANSEEDLKKRLEKLQNDRPTEAELKNQYSLGKNYAKWLLSNLERITINNDAFTEINYRPFDSRWTYFDNKVIWRWREKIMKHMRVGENISLIASKINRQQSVGYFFVSKFISDFHILDTAGDSTFQFPLYLYAADGTKVPNLNRDIKKQIDNIVGETTPEDIFDYVYAVLHSPSYREKYKEFLKIDFPRVPYPKDAEQFRALAVLGGELRLLHLLESHVVNQFITTYPEDGTNAVDNVTYKDNKVFINNKQYFGNVPEIAWNFWIGGYQPAQKWLKDRKGRTLTNSDIEHYQQIVVVLYQTNRIMKEINQHQLV